MTEKNGAGHFDRHKIDYIESALREFQIALQFGRIQATRQEWLIGVPVMLKAMRGHSRRSPHDLRSRVIVWRAAARRWHAQR